jgi:SAM-dependent methyltransferase
VSDLERAEHTWDTIDIDRVRSVAWSSLAQVSGDVWQKFGQGRGGPAEVEALLRGHDRDEPLVGAALVCGDMESERLFFEHRQPSFGTVDGYDLSAVSMARYQPDGVEFRAHKVDCNRLDLPVASYDLIVANHGAHHVWNLGNLFYQANKALKPDGLFYMYEWIGPRYLQIPYRNRAVAWVLLVALFRRSTRTTHMGKLKGRSVQDPPSAFDPSEACNSNELMPQFLHYFEPVARHDHAALTYPIFEGIAQNLDPTRASVRRRITLVLTVERWLTRIGLVRPLFSVAIGRPRPDVM